MSISDIKYTATQVNIEIWFKWFNHTTNTGNSSNVLTKLLKKIQTILRLLTETAVIGQAGPTFLSHRNI